MKLIVGLGFFGLMAVLAHEARAQEPPQPSPTPEAVLVNQKLVAKVEEVEKTAHHILREDEGLAYLALRERSYAAKTQFVFFRRRGTRLQMIAMGWVQGEHEDPQTRVHELVVNIDKDSIVKYPQVGDFGVPLADPMATSLGEKQDNSNTTTTEEPLQHDQSLPGYAEFGLGLLSGQLASDGDPQVGGGKNSRPYRFMLTHVEYFSGMIPLGIAFNSHAGVLPTSTYTSKIVNSSEAVSQINVYYRFKPFANGHVQMSATFFMLSDTLTTDNTGSELLTTGISAVGAGVRAQYLFADEIWKPKNEHRLAVSPLNVFAELGFSPLVDAKDAGPSRGVTSTGSTLMEYRVGASMFMWISFIPLLKRWILQGSLGARKYSLHFQGQTISEVGNPLPVSEGLSFHESETDYRFFLGIRIGDPIESIFSGKPPEKKK